MKTIDLNLSSRYCANWGANEILREFYSNALDTGAAPSVVEAPNGGCRIFSDAPCPPLTHLTVIGGGTKDKDTNTIGQFGEGFKIAALAATRLEYPLSVSTEHGLLSFRFRPSSDTSDSVLVCDIDESRRIPRGIAIDIGVPNWSSILSSTFLPSTIDPFVTRPLLQPPSSPGLYIRGVRVSHLDNYSCSWNFGNANLNRDRSILDTASCSKEIANYFATSAALPPGDPAYSAFITALSNSLFTPCAESQVPNYFTARQCKALLAPVTSLITQQYGAKHFLSYDSSIDEVAIASACGYTPIQAQGSWAWALAVSFNIPTAKTVCARLQDANHVTAFEPCPNSRPWIDLISFFFRHAPNIEAPGPIHVNLSPILKNPRVTSINPFTITLPKHHQHVDPNDVTTLFGALSLWYGAQACSNSAYGELSNSVAAAARVITSIAMSSLHLQ